MKIRKDTRQVKPGDYDIVLNAPKKKKDWRLRGVKQPKGDWRIAGLRKAKQSTRNI